METSLRFETCRTEGRAKYLGRLEVNKHKLRFCPLLTRCHEWWHGMIGTGRFGVLSSWTAALGTMSFECSKQSQELMPHEAQCSME